MKKFVNTVLVGTLISISISTPEAFENTEYRNETLITLDVALPIYNFVAFSEEVDILEVIEVDNTPVVEEKYSAFYIVDTPLNKRQTPNLDFEPIGYLAKGEPVQGVDLLENGWVELSDGSYVNGKYITEQPGMTPEQFDDIVAKFKVEQASILAEKKRLAQIAAQEAERKHQAQLAAQKVANTTASQSSVQQNQSASTPQAAKSSGRNGISISSTDRDLLARLVRAEAGGEAYEGMVAVASVVFNRIANGKFPSTVQGVIYAKNQFSPVANGSINKSASDVHYRAVDDALTRDNTNGATFFYAPSLVKSPYMESLRTVAVIGTHHFKVN